MKNPILSSATVLLAAALFSCSQGAVETANTLPVDSTDTRETLADKAVRVVPTPNQLQALEDGFIAFVHFGPNTFTRREWGDGFEDPSVFDLKELDTDQWVRAMKDAGMTKVILTAKHHDGFVLWQSRYTDHGIMSSPYLDGKGDVMRSLSQSCKKYGLKLGVYLSPADLYQIESPDGLYGNLSEKTRRRIPRTVVGRPFPFGCESFTFDDIDDYNEYYLNQLYELLTEYGPIDEVWLDGAHPKRKGGQTYNYTAWRQLIRKLAPNAVIFGREDIRWCGNEAGDTRDTEWNVITYNDNPATMTDFHDMTDYDLGSLEALSKGSYMHYQPAEIDTSIRDGWFYRDDEYQRVRTADEVFDIYERGVGGNAIVLLNIPPNREGRLSDRDVNTLTEVGRRIRDTYGKDLLDGSKGGIRLGDEAVSLKDGERIIEFPHPTAVNRVMLGEDIANTGERVARHAVDAWIDGKWQQVAEATNIGFKRILRFPDVTTDRLRVRITESRALPILKLLTAHYYNHSLTGSPMPLR